jgi:hypothetical protein
MEEEVAVEKGAVETPGSEEDADALVMRKHNGSAERVPANRSESTPERVRRGLKMYAATHSSKAALVGTHLPFEAQRQGRNRQEYRYGADAPHE